MNSTLDNKVPFLMPYATSYGLPVIPGGDQIQASGASGILVNKSSKIQIIETVVNTNIFYTVPSGKTFYIKSYPSNGLNIDGVTILNNSNNEILVAPSGSVVNYPQNTNVLITGYLK